MTTNVLES